CVINGAVPFSTASVIPRNSSRVSGVRRSPGVGRALGIGLNLLLNQLHAEFEGKGPSFGVLRVSLQCLTDTRQMHVGVPLYREHAVLVRLVAVPAAAIMWCNLVVPAQLCEAFGVHVRHRHAPLPTD